MKTLHLEAKKGVMGVCNWLHFPITISSIKQVKDLINIMDLTSLTSWTSSQNSSTIKEFGIFVVLDIHYISLDASWPKHYVSTLYPS